MSKKKKIGISIAIIILLLVGGAACVYTQITDYVIANMFEAILMEDLEAQGILEVEEKAAGTLEQSQVVDGNQSTQPSGASGQSTTSDEAKEEAAVGADASTTKSGGDSGLTQPTVRPSRVDVEARVKQIVKDIPIRDKNAVMRLVAQNISSSDIRYLSGLASDGNISGGDIAEAKAVAIRSFTPEQLEDVKYYYYKYIGMFSEFYN